MITTLLESQRTSQENFAKAITQLANAVTGLSEAMKEQNQQKAEEKKPLLKRLFPKIF